MLRKSTQRVAGDVPLPKVETDLSRRIRICRVLGIFFVVINHVQPHGDPLPGAPLIVEICRYFFMNVLGHAAVPLLSVISGYLLLGAFGPRGYLRYVRHRFNILIIPMIVWNLIYAGALITVTTAGFDSGGFDRLGDLGFVNAIFGVTEAPINGPLYFLRDMFVISLFAPLLIWAMRRAPFLLMLVITVLAVSEIVFPLVIRPITLFYFCLGLFFRSRGTDLRALDGWLVPIALAALVFWAFGTWFVFNYHVVENAFLSSGWFDQVNRAVVIVVFWLSSAWLLRSAALPVFEWMEKFIYFVFLSHKLVLLFLGGTFKLTFHGYANIYYLGLLALAPIVCVFAAWIGIQLIRFMPPFMQQALTGRDVPKDTRLPRFA